MTFEHGTSDFGQLQLEVSEEVRCSPRIPMGLRLSQPPPSPFDHSLATFGPPPGGNSSSSHASTRTLFSFLIKMQLGT